MAGYSGEMPQVARQVVWKYWSLTEDALEKDFYVSLQSAVAGIIREQLAVSTTRRLWVGREMQLHVGQYKLRARLTALDPILANTCDGSTAFLAQYRERTKDERLDVSTFIAEVIRYPDEAFGRTYTSLVGLDHIKEEMEQKLKVLLNPSILDNWFQRYYAKNPPLQLIQTLRDRYPLIILEGEVGSGKTMLARSIGHMLIGDIGSHLVLYVVNAQVRGGGHVGELTQNISRAFDEAERCQEQEQIPVMLLIDEADALARARGSRQTHHEDDAGVNTLIQRIDRLRGRPMAVIFATNLFQSLDSAILRRAAASFHFDRPDFDQREDLFQRLLGPLGVNQMDVAQMAKATDPRQFLDFDGKFHRYTFSDISQRIMPMAVEGALSEGKRLDRDDIIATCYSVSPTPEYRGINIQNLPNYEKYFEFGYDFSFHIGEELADDFDDEP